MRCQGENTEVMAVECEPEEWKRYWDDMSGKELDGKMVEEARAEELATVKRMKVWVKVDRDQCLKETGRPPIKLRWVDVNKGDVNKPNYRSRIVAKEIKTNSRPDLFAATPPIEHIKYLISRVASSQTSKRPTRLMVQDVKKAYVFAPAVRKVYVELPPEEHEAGKVGLLLKSLYGTRDAALNWTTAYTTVLVEKMGFVQGRSSPCAFYHERLGIRTVVHGDDFVSEGPANSLKEIDAMLRDHFEIKTEVLGPEKECVQQLKILNRVVTWEKHALTWEPDPRHAELVIEQLGLKGAKPLKLPGIKEEVKDGEADVKQKENEVAATYEREMKAEHGVGDAMPDVNEVGDKREARERMDRRCETLRVEGWKSRDGGQWFKHYPGAESMPMPKIDGVRRRTIRNSDTGVLIDDVNMMLSRSPGRLERRMRRRTNMNVTIEVCEVGGEDNVPWEDQPMVESEATQYRAIVARCNFLAVDRPDIMYASKECSRKMSSPANGDWAALKRLGRYLIFRPRVVHVFKWQGAAHPHGVQRFELGRVQKDTEVNLGCVLYAREPPHQGVFADAGQHRPELWGGRVLLHGWSDVRGIRIEGYDRRLPRCHRAMVIC